MAIVFRHTFETAAPKEEVLAKIKANTATAKTSFLKRAFPTSLPSHLKLTE